MGISLKHSNVIFPFVVLFHFAYSQNSTNWINQAGEPGMIDSKKLIGEWRNLDSSGEQIEFVDSVYQIVLLSPRGHPFYFQKDSIGNISEDGWFPLWPPPSCSLNFLANDTLKISLTLIGDTLANYSYVRVH